MFQAVVLSWLYHDPPPIQSCLLRLSPDKYRYPNRGADGASAAHGTEYTPKCLNVNAHLVSTSLRLNILLPYILSR